LTKIERRKKRQKLRGESVCRIIEMNVEVTGDDKFMGSGCSTREKGTEVIEEDREWFSKFPTTFNSSFSTIDWFVVATTNQIYSVLITTDHNKPNVSGPEITTE